MRRDGLLALLAILVGCSDSRPTYTASWTTLRITSGDTTIVRTENAGADAGLHNLVPLVAIGETGNTPEYTFGHISHIAAAPNGNIWVFDSRARALRMYDGSGIFIRNVGRYGEGPGEYQRCTGLVFLKNGNAVLWDERSAALRVYSPSGDHVADLAVPDAGGVGMADFGNTILSDNAGFMYLRGRLGRTNGKMRRGLVRLKSDGSVVDSLIAPTFGVEPAYATASSGSGGTSMTVDFMPDEIWTWSPHGYFLAARSDFYAVHLLHPGGRITRIERTIEAPPLAPGEWNVMMDAITEGLRFVDPKWSWKGPVATHKPFFYEILAGSDGTIWIEVTSPSQVAIDTTQDKADGRAAGTKQYSEPVFYDVFEASGEFIGRVSIPTRARVKGATRDRVWAVTVNNDDVESVTVFRIEPLSARR